MSGWGIEARHSWDGGAIVLGDLTTFPRYRVRSIGGLRGLGDTELTSDPATQRRGEIPRKSSRGGKTIPYTVVIEAQSLADLRDAEETLLAAFDATDERRMTITPHPTYVPAPRPRYFDARCVSLVIGDEQTVGPNRVTLGFEREAIIGLRASDPRVFEVLEQAETTVAGAGASVNRATNPRAGSGVSTGWVNTGSPFFGPVSASAMPTLDGLPKGVDTSLFFTGDASGDRIHLPVAVTNGTTYTFSVYVLALSLTGGGTIHMRATRADGSSVAATASTVSTVGGWTRLTCSFAAVATEDYQLQVRQNAAGGTGTYFTAAQAEAAAVVSDYHDGDMAQSNWSGTAHLSTSSRRIRRDATAVSAGPTDTDPVITIDGDATDPVLRHRELDRVLSFRGTTLALGQHLTVNFKRRTSLLNGVIPTPHARAESDWWDADAPGLVPGPNTIELYRTGAGEAEIVWQDAFPA